MRLFLLTTVQDLNGNRITIPTLFEKMKEFLDSLPENIALSKELIIKHLISPTGEKDLTIRDVLIFLFNNTDLSKQDITLVMSILPFIRTRHDLDLNREQISFLREAAISCIEQLRNLQASKFWQIPLLFLLEELNSEKEPNEC